MTQRAPATAACGSPPISIRAPLRFRPVQHVRGRRQFGRRGEAEGEAETGRGLDPAAGDIVAVAAPGDDLPRNRAAQLFEGHDIGHDLTGMRGLRQAVDHRDRRVSREFVEVFRAIGAEHDAVDVARQHPRGIRDGLAPAELHLLPEQDDGIAAQFTDGHLEADPRAGTRLAKNERDRLASERPCMVASVLLADHGGRQDVPQGGCVDVLEVEEVPGRRRRLVVAVNSSSSWTIASTLTGPQPSARRARSWRGGSSPPPWCSPPASRSTAAQGAARCHRRRPSAAPRRGRLPAWPCWAGSA